MIMARSFPAALKLDNRLCLVVGSGSTALERVHDLLACGARVRFVTTAADAPARELAAAHPIDWCARAYEPSDLDGCWLAVLTDSDAELAGRMAADARARRVFFCAVDQPEVNSFSHLAIARAASLFVAVGSEGATPSLSRRLRQELARMMHESDLAAFVERLARKRAALPKGARAQVMNEAVRDVRITGRIELPVATEADGADAEPRRK